MAELVRFVAASVLFFVSGNLSGALSPIDGIVVLGKDAFMRRCIEKTVTRELESRGLPLIVHPAGDSKDGIRAAFYPWLEIDSLQGIRATTDFLASSPLAAEILAETGLRFIVLVFDRTMQDPDWEGTAGCSYYGCLGFAWTSKETEVRVILIDLTAPDRRDELAVSEEGTTLIPVFFLPIPLSANTQNAACGEMAGQVLAALAARTDGE